MKPIRRLSVVHFAAAAMSLAMALPAGATGQTTPQTTVTIPAGRNQTPWMALQDALDAGGDVTLVNDVAAAAGDESLVVSGAVLLDLNGHTITGNGENEVVFIDGGGDLTLTNSVPSSGAITGGDRGVIVYRGGAFTMNGGAISGNSAEYGGGVYLDYGGVFTMNGGTISGNTAEEAGGVRAMGMFEVSGNTNAVGEASNVYLSNGNSIAVNGLSAGASIGVTTEIELAIGSVEFASGATAGDAARFFTPFADLVIGVDE